MDWSKPYNASFRYMQVSRKTWDEIGRIKRVHPGARITWNLNTQVKVSGSLSLDNPDTIGDDLVRIYADVTQGAKTESICLATLYMSSSKEEFDMLKSVSMELYSPLLDLKQDMLRAPLVIPEGQNAIAYVSQLCMDRNLEVIAEDSDAKLARAWSFDAGKPIIEIINDLLDYAGFSSVGVDAWGRITLFRYRDPVNQKPVYTFVDNAASIIRQKMTREFDWYNTPNVVVCMVSDQDKSIIAEAVDDSPSSPYSTVSRGRRIVRTETISDIKDAEKLKAKAQELLTSSQRLTQSLEFEHGWTPFELGQVIQVEVKEKALSFSGSVQERELTLSPSMQCKTRIRRFVDSKGFGR